MTAAHHICDVLACMSPGMQVFCFFEAFLTREVRYLPKTRKEKQGELEILTGEVREAQVVILTDYRGLPVAEINRLRNQLRDKGATFSVAKNTLTTLALKATGHPAPEDLLAGPTALALIHDDIP